MNILSIHSHVAYGHVGNSAVVFPLQRLGHEVWPVHTAMYSNHAGYPDLGGRLVPAADIGDVIDGLARRGALAKCDAVLSGYLGDAAVGETVLRAVARVRAANSGAIYCCDPVIGDDGRVYVADGLPQLLRAKLAPAADVLTPNLFELALLTGGQAESLAVAPPGATVAAARRLLAPPARTSVVLVTSLRYGGLPPGHVAMAAITPAEAWLVTMPEIAFATPPHGAGDCAAALFCAHLGASVNVARALSLAASAIHALLDETARRGDRELALVDAQDALVAPPRRFAAEPVV